MPNTLRTLPTALLALFFAFPVIGMVGAWFLPAGDGFTYLIQQNLIPEYAFNTVIIAIFTGLLSLLIGVPTAWAVTMWQFPARKLLSWILVLPLAMPAYVAAMIYGYLLEGAGPVQSALRNITGLAFGEYPFPAIRSLSGVIFILTLTLYPYIYLVARSAFLTQPRSMLESGLILGLNQKALFSRLSLPLARPALIGGLAIVMMEALADFGVTSLYGINAFTTGIYRIWQGFYDPIAAARLATLLLGCVLFLLWMERVSRKQARYDGSTQNTHPLPRYILNQHHGWLTAFLCFLPCLFGFFIPLIISLSFSLSHLEVFADSTNWSAFFNSLKLALLTASIATIIGLLFAYALRKNATKSLSTLIRMAASGYAIPGSVIAIGVLWFLVTLQNDLFDGTIFLTGTLLGIVWGCVLRFLTIGFNQSEAGMARITPMMDEAAATLGAGRGRILREIHLPLLKVSLLSGFLLIFIDTVKELPATILLRPFNFDTLAIRTYELASDDLLPHAAPTALLLIIVSLPAIGWINHKLETITSRVHHG